MNSKNLYSPEIVLSDTEIVDCDEQKNFFSDNILVNIYD